MMGIQNRVNMHVKTGHFKCAKLLRVRYDQCGECLEELLRRELWSIINARISNPLRSIGFCVKDDCVSLFRGEKID